MTPLARIAPTALFILATGCVVHGYPCKDDWGGGSGSEDAQQDGSDLLDDGSGTAGDDGGDLLDGSDGGGGDGAGDDGGTDTGEPLDTGDLELPEPPTFALSPAEVVQGEAVTATLLADEPGWDHTAVVDLAVGSGLVLCTLEATPDGVEVVYGAWGDAPLGEVDVEVDLAEAGLVVLEGGIRVTPPGGIVTPDPDADPCAAAD